MNIKFIHKFNEENIPFLGLKVSLSGGQLTTDLHIKSTYKHQCLHYTSTHPDHTKRSIVFSQALRVSRICSNKTDFERHLDDMNSWFQARGYPKHLVQKEMSKVRFNKENSNTKQSKSKRVTFVVTYHPLLKSFQNAKEVFMPGPMVTFRSTRKLISYLVKDKLYPLERVTGSCRCHGKRCAVCPNINEKSTFTSSVPHEVYKINHKFDCNSKCLIYLLTCKQCSKQYVGQTIDDFRFRWNNYKDNNRKYQCSETCMQEHPFRYFSSPGQNGILNDVSITLIDKIDPSDPLQREDYSRITLKTMSPFWG